MKVRRIKKIEKRLDQLEKEIKYQFLQPGGGIMDPFHSVTMETIIDLILDHLNLEIHREYAKPERQVLKKREKEK